jgi:hypothetical protein
MHRTLHQLRFDLLRFWPLLVLWGTLLALQILTTALISGPRLKESLPVAWLVLEALLLWVAVPILVQSDSPLGSQSFWLTRPLSGGQMLGAKALFLSLLVVSATGATLLSPPGNGSRALEMLALLAVEACLLLPTAALTRSLMTYLGLHLLLPLASLAVVLVHPAYTIFTHSSLPNGPALKVAVLILALAFGLSAVIYQYLTRRPRLSWSLWAAALLLYCFSSGIDPFQSRSWNRSRPAVSTSQKQPSQAARPAAALALKIDPASLRGEGDGSQTRSLFGNLEMHGLPAGLIAVPEAVDARLDLGGEPYSYAGTSHARVPVGGRADGPDPELQALSQAMDQAPIFASAGDESPRLQILLARVEGDALDITSSDMAVYRGEVAFRLYQLQPHSWLPLEPQPGAQSFPGPRRVLRVERQPGGLTYDLNAPERATSPGRPEVKEPAYYLLFHRQRREGLLEVRPAKLQPGEAAFSGHLPGSSIPLRRVVFRFPEGLAIDDLWLQDARLVRVLVHDYGTVRRTARAVGYIR